MSQYLTFFFLFSYLMLFNILFLCRAIYGFLSLNKKKRRRETMFSYSIHSILTVFFYTLLLFDTSRTAKQKIYYGELDLFHQLLNYTSQWTYVQQNVDGFYVNFLQLLVNMKPDD